MKNLHLNDISLCVVKCLLRAKEGDGERVRESEGKWEREGDWERKIERERDPHKLEGEASRDHPIGEGLG